MSKQRVKVKDVLEKLYAKYNRREFIKSDPLQFVYRYSSKEDMEIAGFLAALLAYGKVEQIKKSVTDLLGRMGHSPFEFVRKFDKHHRKELDGFKHRFTKASDISDLLELLREVFEQNGSMEQHFLLGYRPDEANIINALSRFCKSLLGSYSNQHNGVVAKGLQYLLVLPESGSACKRLNLFLRWMVRNDDVDTGLWKTVDKAKLIVPVDVHMGRLCRLLGLYDQKTVSLSAAVKITESFREIEPADPVKYDFALSRIGIVENCTGRIAAKCEPCELLEYCLNQKDRT